MTTDGEVVRPRIAGAARKATLLAGTALSLALSASVVHAQCTSDLSQGYTANTFTDYGLLGSGAVSTVQSLISVLNTTNTAFLTQTSGFIGAPANPGPNQGGGGTWARGIGGTFDTNVPGTYTYTNAVSPLIASGGGTCRTRSFQDFGGVQVGADISRLNINGANVHIGVTAGYTESTIRSPTGPGAQLNGQFQIPFFGIYGAVTRGGFFVDGQVRWDFVQGLINDPVTSGIFNQRVDARSLTLTGNIGNQFQLGDDWFIEPSIGGLYSQAKVDAFNITGTAILLNSPGFSPPSSIKINDFDSLLGRASVRLGRNFIVGPLGLQPFITASVFHEFAGNVRTSIFSSYDPYGQLAGLPAGTLSLLDTNTSVTSRRIGTYGQFSGGLAGQILNTGWLGYVRGDYRTGDRVDGWGISGGVRYQFTPEQVVARNVVRKGYDAPPLLPAMEAPMNWTGLSVGASIGGNWDQARRVGTIFTLQGVSEPHAAGIIAGGQVGADYQLGNVVVGVAGDFNWANARGGRPCQGAVGLIFNCETNVDSLITATGRVGYVWDRVLFYAKGGYAVAALTEGLTDLTGGQPLALGAGGGFLPFPKIRNTADGWTLGAGFEFALTRNWTAKAEYMHYDLGRRQTNFAAGTVTTNTTTQHTGNLVRVGVNYRFNFDPVPAPMAAAPAVVAKY